MPAWPEILAAAALLPVVGGSVYALLCVGAAALFARRRDRPPAPVATWPPVSLIKPICGLEKDLAKNLRSACSQDYPAFQVVLSIQRPDDPALPLLRKLESEFGPERVSVVVADSAPVVNGKIQNLVGALAAARHDLLVISDSDVRLRPDYLRTIVAPLADPEVGCVCTLYRAVRAESWFERLELLTLNAEFIVSVIFASVTGASGFCLGASTALRRSTLAKIGGLEPLAEYLVEDYEMGRRIREQGFRFVLVPYFVDMMVDLSAPADWWRHQVYWDQNTKAARPIGFFATVLIRAVPFALLFAALRGFDPLGSTVLAATLAWRLITTAATLHLALRDREGLRSLALLPLRDLAGLASWLAALVKTHFVWRGYRFRLLRGGRIEPRNLAT